VHRPKQLQLATLVDEPPQGDEWLHEQKLDGYRIYAELDRGKVSLFTRRFNDWTSAFPTIAAAVAKLPARRAALDGEVAAVLPDGRTSFQALQNLATSGATIAYFIFDLLALDDDDLAPLPLDARKARLAELLRDAPPELRYCDHVIGDGAAFFHAACTHGLEGIVSKRRDKPYTPGRNTFWVKTKCLLRQELVIGGFTDPEGARSSIGALLVGYYDGDRLAYAGKVGTGFTNAMLVELGRALRPLEIATSPFDPEPARAWTGANRHWVQPKLVGEVAFSEWTNDGRLRHPSFQGLRGDKAPREIVRERPISSPAPRARSRTSRSAPRGGRSRGAKSR